MILGPPILIEHLVSDSFIEGLHSRSSTGGSANSGRAPPLWKLKLDFSKLIAAAVSGQNADAKGLREEIYGRNYEIFATIDRAESDVKIYMEADSTAKLMTATKTLETLEASVNTRKTEIESLSVPPCEVGPEIANRMKHIKTTVTDQHMR